MITPTKITDSARYASFSQSVKMRYWENGGWLTDRQLEGVLLVAWEQKNADPLLEEALDYYEAHTGVDCSRLRIK